MGRQTFADTAPSKVIILEFRLKEFVIPPKEKLASRPGRAAHRNTETETELSNLSYLEERP